MRQFFRMLFLALVLMTVALVSALTAMQFAIHGREVAIPKFIGATPAEAERAAVASGLQVVIERQFYSADIAEGKIMTQIPPPGTKVRRGWLVRVAQSLGPQRIAIPNLTGGSERVAELSLQRRRLSLGSVAHVSFPDALADQVIAQNPPANASGVASPKMNLLISDGAEPAAFVMPNLAGQLLGSATLALKDAGMKVGKVSMVAPILSGGSSGALLAGSNGGASTDAPVVPVAAPASEPNPASVIVNQTPAAGQKIVAGSMVNLEVR